MAAFLMAGSCNGLNEAEAAHLTTAMLRCGQQVNLDGLQKPKVDCHSTGGVGDKVSLIAAPIAAAAGIAVPVIAEPGIGHTGGALDKLESIPDLRTNLSIDAFQDLVFTKWHCFLPRRATSWRRRTRSCMRFATPPRLLIHWR